MLDTHIGKYWRACEMLSWCNRLHLRFQIKASPGKKQECFQIFGVFLCLLLFSFLYFSSECYQEIMANASFLPISSSSYASFTASTGVLFPEKQPHNPTNLLFFFPRKIFALLTLLERLVLTSSDAECHENACYYLGAMLT